MDMERRDDREEALYYICDYWQENELKRGDYLNGHA